MATRNDRKSRSAALNATHAANREKWSGRKKITVLGSTAFLSWLPILALGYACTKLIG